MLISEFCKVTGLSRDTVRFYLRLGLFAPNKNRKGGSRPYRSFADEDILLAANIRISQSLGMSLKEIVALNDERNAGKITPERRLVILRERLLQLEEKAAEMASMMKYMRAKIEWLESSSTRPAPDFKKYLKVKAKP
jgi:DNA-binding transcriptional MerR regulator